MQLSHNTILILNTCNSTGFKIFVCTHHNHKYTTLLHHAQMHVIPIQNWQKSHKMLQVITMEACGTCLWPAVQSCMRREEFLRASVRGSSGGRCCLPWFSDSSRGGMLLNFSKTLASGSSAGVSSGSLQSAVCSCWVMVCVRSPRGCIVTGEGGDCWCELQSHPPSPFSIHTHTHNRGGWAWLSFTGLSLSDTLFHFFPPIADFFPGGLSGCACVFWFFFRN